VSTRVFELSIIFATTASLSTGLPANAEDRGMPQPSLASSLPEPLGSFGGLRPYLAPYGVTFQLNYTGDAFGIVSGGLKQGLAYAGLFELIVETDLETALGWKGATFHVGSYAIHGNGPSQNFVGNMMFISDVEALPTVRLDEIWLEQKFLNDRASIRIGQLAADVEFATSPLLDLIVGGTFGWHSAFAANLPSGGPAYPFATPAVRLKYEPTDDIAILAALFNGDPAGPGLDDPELRNRHGLNFRLNDPPFLIAELQWKHGPASALGGTIKLGGWYHFGEFADVRLGQEGLPLGDAESVAQPLQHQGDFGVYGLIDQQLFRKSSKADAGVYTFARVAASPSNRNLVDFYADAGLTFQGMIERRPNDSFGFAAAFAKISGNASFDTTLDDGTLLPTRDYEALLEATYSFEMVPGFTVQPNLQYVIHPGQIVDHTEPQGLRAIPNAFVVGIRTTVKY
jgi:porin